MTHFLSEKAAVCPRPRGPRRCSPGQYAQFILAAGGGFRGGAVVGATDKVGAQVTDKFYKVESFGRTLYHLLGIDPDAVVRTPADRPVRLIAEEAPLIKEAIT
jgi:hypothetical protein